MSNTVPSAEQYSTRNVGKAVDERKNEQHGAIRSAIRRATLVKADNERKNEQNSAIWKQYGVQPS